MQLEFESEQETAGEIFVDYALGIVFMVCLLFVMVCVYHIG